ncbi:MAG: tetratricopeptide repeat protein, partial [Deltaproteobacteria bacterium]|nr:tetratricopeptide repeat protein [Deltaproteobacteria bacterium]MBW2536422.1 tetratricopeptide repeat protein [Deltaproteobacteria bacterium]
QKVIHVAFGPGGGRVPRPPPGAEPVEVAPRPLASEPVADLYTQAEVGKLLGLSRGRLRSLDRAGIVRPSGRLRGNRAYTFNDIIALRAAKDLLEHKVRLRKVAQAIERVRTTLPTVTRPLSELRVVSDGREVVVRTAEGSFEPLTGQMVIDFDVRQLQEDVVRVLRPRAAKDRTKQAYELYLKASQLDENPDTMDEAESLYREALRCDPSLAIVYTNLGNVRFRCGDEEQAEALYRTALLLEKAQPEAQYNLGYMKLHSGRPAEAIAFFEGAIAGDAEFADAYFNLAMAYEQCAEPHKARRCWQRYLDIEPDGTWAEVARQHLEQ